MAVRRRSPVTPCAVVAWLTTGAAPRPLGLRQVRGRLTARLWKRRLSLFGLLLLTCDVLWMAHGRVAGGGWVGRGVEAMVCLEVVLMGGGLLCIDLVELLRRVMRRRAVARQLARERRAKATAPGGPS